MTVQTPTPQVSTAPADPPRESIELSAVELSAPAGAVHDSLTVATWTILSRVTGFVRIVVVAAVLGATFFGNTYQFTNSLPNLVYYGFLAGSLFSSLLVPALVRHIDRGDSTSAERVASGLFGIVAVAMAAALPIALLAAPHLLGLAGPARSSAATSDAVLLVAMLMPQILLYSVIGTSTAVQNAHGRFAIPAAAPLIENLGTIAVLVAVWALFPRVNDVNQVPLAELLLLGIGSTAAVGLHATVQWWGARRCGVVLRPRPGWRDPEVRVVVRRAVPSLVQAGAAASELILLLVLANRIAGGVVAFQIALNFYFLPVAIAATPVALSLIPRLSRLPGHGAAFRDTWIRGLTFAGFLLVPAAVGYVVLAGPLGQAIALGRMNSPFAIGLVVASLRFLGPGLVGEAAFLIMTYTLYARRDTRTPLFAMGVQVLICLVGASASLPLHGRAALATLGAALSAATLSSSAILCVAVARKSRGTERLGPPLGRILAGAAIMAVPAWFTAGAVSGAVKGRIGDELAVGAAILVGASIYFGLQFLWHARELEWVTSSFGLRRGTATLEVAPESRPTRGRSYSGRVRRAVSGSVDHGIANTFLAPSPRALTLAVACLGAAVGVGLLVHLSPALALGIMVVGIIAVWVYCRPAAAAYLVIFVTPLLAGINRGSVIPFFRPNEVIDLLVGGVLVVRGLVKLRAGSIPRPRLDRLEWSLVAMATCSSVVPLLWMYVRGVSPTSDDLLYSLVLWKYFGLYLLVRFSIRTEKEVQQALTLSIAACAIVCFVAVLQSLDLFGVPTLLSKYYAPFGVDGALTISRGSSLLSLPAAVADLAILNLAFVVGMWHRRVGNRWLLGALGALFLFGVLAAGEFSSVLGLLAAAIPIAFVVGGKRVLSFALPGLAGGALVLRPVISTRLEGFQTATGLPVSWQGRLNNLRTYFWPQFSNFNWILGVRPAARVPSTTQAFGYVWIESGYTWLLWGGGVPLLASYVAFLWIGMRRAWQLTRIPDAVGVAALGVLAILASEVVSMIFDPHITYRGSADAIFATLALARPGLSRARRPA